MAELCYEDFVIVIKRTIINILGRDYEDWEVTERDVFRINEKLLAINVTPPERSTFSVPNIYPAQYFKEYEEGRSITEILDEIRDTVRRYDDSEKIQQLVSKEALLDSVLPILINTKINREYLKTLPHKDYLDLSKCFRAIYNVEGGSHMGTTITWDILEDWNMTYDMLERRAEANLRRKTRPKFYVLNDILTITNNYSIYGAVIGMTDMNLLKRIADKKDDDLYVIPSSIHEVFVVPVHECRVESLKKAAKGAVKAGVLEEKDFLSDNIYRFKRNKRVLEIV